MYKKIVVAIGAVLLVASLAFPVTATKQVQTGFSQVKPNSYLFNTSQPIYSNETYIDYYKTGVRAVAILAGTVVLAFILPGNRNRKQG